MTDHAVHSARMVKENHSAATDHVVHSARAEKENHFEISHVAHLEKDHSERIAKEEASVVTDHVAHLVKTAREDHSAEEDQQLVEEDSTLARRVLQRESSIISATRTRAESIE